VSGARDCMRRSREFCQARPEIIARNHRNPIRKERGRAYAERKGLLGPDADGADLAGGLRPPRVARGSP